MRNLHKPFYWGVLLSSTLMSGTLYADTLPWLAEHLQDPFSAQKKADRMIEQDLRPDNCLSLPDVTRRLDFNQVVLAALCHNPDTRAAYLGLLADAATYASNYSLYLPTATATAGRSRTTTFAGTGKSTIVSPTYSLSSSLTLYDFGQREFKMDIAELTLIAAGYDYNSSLQALIDSALQAYYALLTAQTALDIAKESEHYAKESYDAARLRHKIGLAPLSDELQAEGAYSQAQLATEQASNQLSQQQAALALLLGMKADTSLQAAEVNDDLLTKDPFGGQVQALMAEAKEKRPDLLASKIQLKSSEESLAALKRADLATVALTTDVGSSGPNANMFNRYSTRTQAVGISVSIPIFTGFSQTYNELAAMRQLEAQQVTLDKTQLTVEQDVWNNWHTFQIAKQSWDTSAVLLKSALELKDVALGRYKEGLGSILDLLNAQIQYSTALQSRLQARYTLLTARVDLIKAVGLLNLNSMQPDRTMTISSVDGEALKP